MRYESTLLKIRIPCMLDLEFSTHCQGTSISIDDDAQKIKWQLHYNSDNEWHTLTLDPYPTCHNPLIHNLLTHSAILLDRCPMTSPVRHLGHGSPFYNIPYTYTSLVPPYTYLSTYTNGTRTFPPQKNSTSGFKDWRQHFPWVIRWGLMKSPCVRSRTYI